MTYPLLEVFGRYPEASSDQQDAIDRATMFGVRLNKFRFNSR